MRIFIAAACLLATPVLAAAPILAPTRDVVIDYAVRPADRPPLGVQVSVQAGGALLRITSPDLPTAFVVDRPAQTATVLLPMLKLYARVAIGRYDPQRTVLRNASFERGGQSAVAGRSCTEWRAASSDGRATACITADGVILRGTATDAHGSLGSIQATMVQYVTLSPALFRRPEDFHDAGTLPLDGGLAGALGGLQQ